MKYKLIVINIYKWLIIVIYSVRTFGQWPVFQIRQEKIRFFMFLLSLKKHKAGEKEMFVISVVKQGNPTLGTEFQLSDDLFWSSVLTNTCERYSKYLCFISWNHHTS